MLYQDDKPVAYLSQALLTLPFGAAFHYPHWPKDQKSLKFLIDQRLVGEDQFKWSTKLIGLDFKIHYRPIHENKAVDALSRQMAFAALSLAYSSLWEQVDEEIQQDPHLS